MRAATAEFVAHGFAGARISRIVKKAGTNPRMIYQHFGSKSALYVAALENALAELRGEELGSMSSISIPWRACFSCLIS